MTPKRLESFPPRQKKISNGNSKTETYSNWNLKPNK